jgi:hypothetical protein
MEIYYIIRSMRWARHVAQMCYMHKGYWRESQKERDHWENRDAVRWTILGWILEREDGMDVAQDRVQWRALVNMVMNLRIPKILGIS